jgi:hypothetical protein
MLKVSMLRLIIEAAFALLLKFSSWATMTQELGKQIKRKQLLLS